MGKMPLWMRILARLSMILMCKILNRHIYDYEDFGEGTIVTYDCFRCGR